MEQEIWLDADLPGFHHKYLVSSHGRIKRAATTIIYVDGRRRHLPERILKQGTDGRGGGYLMTCLQRGGPTSNKQTVKLAPLICRAFNGPPLREGMHCAHLNGNRLDNRPVNLAWVTPCENEAHKRMHGTLLMGERHHQAKLTEAAVAEIRATPRTYGSGVALARKFGVSPDQIGHVRAGRSWGHL